ncbi:MAG: A/G-specific adenine glycosylase [Pirellulales bacterium]
MLDWFATAQRDLPWRRTRDPYHVWVSEIMLQQTQVATVVPYFSRFMAAFPNLAALAAAEEQQVLRLWEGLGYYRRARQLHRAAQICVERHDGKVPTTAEAVRELPGIGRYTAGAILSIAYGQPQPIVEANTLRVYSRLLGSRGNPYGTTGQQLLWQAAQAILPPRQPGELNQALMELGALVCTPTAPDCPRCPVAALCAARVAGVQLLIPPPKPQPAITALREAAVVVRRRNRVLLVRRGQAGRWAGLWDFPRFELQAASPPEIAVELQHKVRALAAVEIALGETFATLKHGVTRYAITLTCHQARYKSAARGTSPAPEIELRWLEPEELVSYPLNATGRKIAQMVGE